MKPIGHVDDITRFSVTGWAADQDNPDRNVKVVIILNGRECARVLADGHRGGLEELRPGSTGKYGFLYYFNPPLSPFTRNEVQIKVERTEHVLSRGHAIIEAARADAPAETNRPAAPILLSTSGRSGSTVTMGILAEHPQIVVADKRPFEVEMLCYYSYALRTLAAAGDHRSSLRPDRITAAENRFKIGFNPYTSPGFRRNFNNPELFDRFFFGALPKNLAHAFRETILDYYSAVTEDTGKHTPLYFAEKSLPEREVRLGSRFLFSNVKEVVLFRDLRDSLCSVISRTGANFDQTLDALASSGMRYLEIKANHGRDTHFLKYEDLIQQPSETLSRLYQFLGLHPMTHLDPSNMTGLFKGHGSSRNPAESIGRWQRDLSREQLEKCRPFARFLDAFGYEPLPGPEPHPVLLASAEPESTPAEAAALAPQD